MQQLEQILFGVTVFAYLAAALLATFGLAYRRKEADRVGVWALAAGFVAQTVSLVLRWIAGGRAPLAGMHETLAFLSWSTVLLFLIADRRYKVKAAGLILVPGAFFMAAIAALLYEGPRPLQADLQSHWLTVHASVSLLGYAAFALAFASGFFYVVQEDLLKKNYAQVRALIRALIVVLGTGTGTYVGYLIADPTLFEDATGHRVYAYSQSDWTIIGIGAGVGLVVSLALGLIAARGAARPSFANRLPSLSLLDRLSFHSVVFGVALLSVGIVTGAIWARAVWGSWWEWDPKQTWALAAWLFYSGYLGVRGLANWRGRHAALLAIAGLFLILFTFLGINFFVPGKHDFN